MPKTATIPTPQPQYDLQDQIISRRTTEQLIQEAFVDIENNQDKKSKTSSLALRRFQFLLMGAS